MKSVGKSVVVFGLASFALAGCLGSDSSSGSGSSVRLEPSETLPALPPTEVMPTSGSATYSGTVNMTLTAESQRFAGEEVTIGDGTMSMRANFTPTGGTVTDGRLTFAGASGALEQSNAVSIEGNGFSDMALEGTLRARAGGETARLESGGDNTLLASGEFQGDDAAQVEITFGGRILGDESIPEDPDVLGVTGGGVLVQP